MEIAELRTRVKIALEDLEKGKANLKHAQARYLRAMGWTETCRYGTRWLWKRDLPDGGVILMSLDNAVDYESYIDLVVADVVEVSFEVE